MFKTYISFSDSNTWSILETQGVKPRARDKLQAVSIDDKIYYFGGFGPKSDEAEVDEDDVGSKVVSKHFKTDKRVIFNVHNL